MDHYFIPTKKPLILSKMLVRLKNKEPFELYTASGLFSKNELDKGSQVLIEHCVLPETCTSVLDLGCGVGIVGVSLLRQHRSLKMTFSDINSRALKVTRSNLKLYGLTAEVVESNLFEKIPEKFDLILSNPPQSAGKKVCERLVRDSFLHLHPGGHLQFVIRKNKGGESLSKVATDVFGSFSVLAKKGGFWVYDCER
ncbi:MAG: methyltransferase [archaeon]